MDNSIWVEFSKVDYNLDLNSNRESEYVNEIGPFHYKMEYEYDLTEVMSNYAHPFKGKQPSDYMLNDFPFENKVLSKKTSYFDTITNDYKLPERITYNYDAPLVLDLSDLGAIAKTNLYPNPSSDFIQISGITKPEKVAVYNLSGIKIFETVLNHGEKLNIQKLQNGLYLLKFQNGNILKFVKK